MPSQIIPQIIQEAKIIKDHSYEDLKDPDLINLMRMLPSERDEALHNAAVKFAEAKEYDYGLQVAEAIEDARLKKGALCKIACRYAQDRHYDQALKITGRIEWSPAKNSALRGIAIKLAETGGFDRSLEIAKTIRYVVDKAGALYGIASEVAKLGEKERASQVLLQAFQEAKEIKIDREKGILGKIALKYAEIGEYDQALEVVKIIKSPYSKAGVLAKIGLAYEKAGKRGDDRLNEILCEIIEGLF